ncbi:MAG: hypothetical protein Q9205_006321 [Flavoplaca limonia]
MRFSKFRALCKELFCGCTSLQSKEETASPAPRPIISAPIPHFKEWVQDPRDAERWNPAYGKWISDGVHEPYQEKRKWDTYGEPFVPKRLPIPQWQRLGPHEDRVTVRKTSSVYSRPTASPSPTVLSADSELERVGDQIERLQARNAVSPESRLWSVSEEGGPRKFNPKTQALLDAICGYPSMEMRAIPS